MSAEGTIADPVDLLIRDFQARGWQSEPFERALTICKEQPHEIGRRVMAVLDRLPQCFNRRFTICGCIT